MFKLRSFREISFVVNLILASSKTSLAAWREKEGFPITFSGPNNIDVILIFHVRASQNTKSVLLNLNLVQTLFNFRRIFLVFLLSIEDWSYNVAYRYNNHSHLFFFVFLHICTHHEHLYYLHFENRPGIEHGCIFIVWVFSFYFSKWRIK